MIQPMTELEQFQTKTNPFIQRRIFEMNMLIFILNHTVKQLGSIKKSHPEQLATISNLSRSTMLLFSESMVGKSLLYSQFQEIILLLQQFPCD